MGSASPRPGGLLAACTFFAVAGLLELTLSLWELPRPWTFWPVWETLGRALLYVLLALGLWQRKALCRTIALVYCLAAIVLYVAVVGLAVGQAPFRFPPSLVIQSLFQVPSCVLLFAYLRSPRAGAVFTRPLFG
jgi:hypothetical protein